MGFTVTWQPYCCSCHRRVLESQKTRLISDNCERHAFATLSLPGRRQRSILSKAIKLRAKENYRKLYRSGSVIMVAETSPSTTELLEQYLQSKKDLVERNLKTSVPLVHPNLTLIQQSMLYSLMAGGKRIRPILCLATCELFGGKEQSAIPTAIALEMIHTMSLIHDDLPAMDNDDFRRGKPTNHKVYGEDIAILAGDALLTHAFEYIASETKDVPDKVILRLIGLVAASVGYCGIVGGQVLDIQSEGKDDIGLEDLIWIHKHKTGALLKCCVVTGALIGGAREEDLLRLGEYAEKIGLAFQVADDVLDVTSSFEKLGKSIGKDEKSNKMTFPRLLGVEESKKYAKRLVQDAKLCLEPYEEKAFYLKALADFIISRSF
eukprot:jgi/Galph1/4409/GphlegSOOS_G3065.1